MNKTLLAVAWFPATALLHAQSAEPAEPVIQLPAFRIEAESEKDHTIQDPFLPDTQGTKINAGKKTTVLDFDSLPRITGNNYRQALSEAPGLILSEETTPLISIGYRGLSPSRAQFTQVLKDGIPIHADQFGYPEAYYAPPLDTVDRIEFIRGGAALMYGPQPGGALNYVTHRPRTDTRLGGSTLHTLGSNGYYSTFSYLDGTTGPLGYYAYHNHRESSGIRTANSDYRLDAWSVRFVAGAETSSRLIFTAEDYTEEHGEPGGLTFDPAPGAVNYQTQRTAPSRLHDRFALARRSASVAWERDYSRGTLVARAWGIDYHRASRRQRGGGFGTLPSGPASSTTTIERQQFDQMGAELRARLDWGGRQVLTAGSQYFRGSSPREDARGASPDTWSGEVRLKTDRDTRYHSFYVENLFRLGPLSLTPGARMELVDQSVRELANADRTGLPLQSRDRRSHVPLLGLGASWDLPAPDARVYANVSQSYRPLVFTEAVPNGATTVVNSDLREGHAIQFELGTRARPSPGLVLDASVFRLEFDDQVGSITLPGGLSSVANLGRSVHDGIEAGASYDLFARREHPATPTVHPSLTLYANALLLDASFRAGPNNGRVPQYAPRHLVRAGAAYARGDQLKLALTGTLSAASFGDDNNTAQRRIPGYAVWDLTAEWRVPGSPLRLIGGINNLLNEDYYSRASASGIDPAPRRNAYLGAALEF